MTSRSVASTLSENFSLTSYHFMDVARPPGCLSQDPNQRRNITGNHRGLRYEGKKMILPPRYLKGVNNASGSKPCSVSTRDVEVNATQWPSITFLG